MFCSTTLGRQTGAHVIREPDVINTPIASSSSEGVLTQQIEGPTNAVVIAEVLPPAVANESSPRCSSARCRSHQREPGSRCQA